MADPRLSSTPPRHAGRSTDPVPLAPARLEGRLDGDDLIVSVAVAGHEDAPRDARVSVHGAGTSAVQDLAVGGHDGGTASLRLDVRGAERWSPQRPTLHDLLIDVSVEGRIGTTNRLRVGLRDVDVAAGLLTLDGIPVRLRGAVVRRLPVDRSAPTARADAEELVGRAAALGLNALYVAGAADETFLDVCDDRGMLVAVDGDGAAGQEPEWLRSEAAHPSVVLLSVPGGARSCDGSIALRARGAADGEGLRPVLPVRGGHGLPEPEPGEAPTVADTLVERARAAGVWPGSAAGLRRGTRERQGSVLRREIEALRRSDGAAFWLDPLLDEPADSRGVLETTGEAKPETAEHVLDACQALLPSLAAPAVVPAGATLVGRLFVVNDGGPLTGVEVRVRLAGVEHVVAIGEVAGSGVTDAGVVELAVPTVAGPHVVDLRVRVDDGEVAWGGHRLHVVATATGPEAVRLLGGDDAAAALAAVGVGTGADRAPTVVGEGRLGDEEAADVTAVLEHGGTVLVLAQPPGVDLPGAGPLRGVTNGPGPPFLVTTDSGALPSLPRRAVLDVPVGGMAPTAVYGTSPDGDAWRTTVVSCLEPDAGGAGTVVAERSVGAGRLVVCQLRLTQAAVDGDAAARATLTDVLRWAASPVPRPVVEPERMEDGRHITYYTLPEARP